MELIIIENQKPKKILQLPVLGDIEEKVRTVNINNNLQNHYKKIIKIKTKKMEHKILIMCMLMMLFSCKKRDKLIFRIIKEVEGIKKVQYLCLEKKTGLKYIQEYIGDTLLERKYYLNSKNDPEGECIYYDSIGNIEQKFYINKNGEIDGLCTFYYPSGKISEIHYYDNGVKGLQEYYLENGFLKCVYYFDGNDNKMVHKKNIIIENGAIKDTIEKLFPIIKFEKDTVRVGEEFSLWFKRPKSKYISDDSQWMLVYDIQKIRKNIAVRDPTNELVLDTFYTEKKIKLYEKGQNLLYFDVYRDSAYLCSNDPLIIYVK